MLNFDAHHCTQDKRETEATGFDSVTSFIYDVNENDVADDDGDFYISTVYFRLNDSHNHACIADSAKGTIMSETLIGTNGYGDNQHIVSF